MATDGNAEVGSPLVAAAAAVGEAAPKAAAKAAPILMIGTGKRKRPAIDLDHTIEAARQAAKAAGMAMTKARVEQRNERRKKARLLKKAGQLSPQDLERIAVLKRTGFWDPAAEDPRVPNANASSGSGGSAEVSAAASSDAPANHTTDEETENGDLAEDAEARAPTSEVALTTAMADE